MNEKIAKQLKKALSNYYGERFVGLTLFGSYARGDFEEESDIDFAVILKDTKISAVKEIINTAHLISSIALKYNAVVSLLPVSETRIEESNLPIFQNIRKEGIRI